MVENPVRDRDLRAGGSPEKRPKISSGVTRVTLEVRNVPGLTGRRPPTSDRESDVFVASAVRAVLEGGEFL
ncbi:hypothetical protein, partial [Methanopyrus sp.]